MSNMDLWNRVSKTNPNHTKEVNIGRKITAIDPYRQIEAATQEFGPAGQGWGWEVVRFEKLEVINQIGVLVRVWIKDHGSVDQWGQAGLYIDKAEKKKDGDCLKKATTDGITKCLSYMGFNADVFLGLFDDNKYVAERKAESAAQSFELDDNAKMWIEAIKSGNNKPDEIVDVNYRKFIMEKLK